MTADTRNLLAAVIASVLGIAAVRTLGLMMAGHAVAWLRHRRLKRHTRRR